MSRGFSTKVFVCKLFWHIRFWDNKGDNNEMTQRHNVKQGIKLLKLSKRNIKLSSCLWWDLRKEIYLMKFSKFTGIVVKLLTVSFNQPQATTENIAFYYIHYNNIM